MSNAKMEKMLTIYKFYVAEFCSCLNLYIFAVTFCYGLSDWAAVLELPAGQRILFRREDVRLPWVT
jgi:hypothetical protein